MTSLLILKQQIKTLFGKYEAYFLPIIKFIIAFTVLLIINGKLGFMSQINHVAIVLIAALFCSFMPMNFIVLIGALFIELHLYKLSMECALVIGVLFLLMLLLYFRFSPKDALVVVLTPICFGMHIPYVMPMAMGLLGTPVSAISIACGIIVYYGLAFIVGDTNAIVGMADAEATSKIKYMIDGLIQNKTMMVYIVAFCVVLFAVYMIRRLDVDYAWTIAISVGTIVNIVALLVGDIICDINVPILGVILGSIISGALAFVVQFMNFTVDYKRTEKVQFEDDEYYYYVKAVPKVTVSKPVKKVKKINTKKNVNKKVSK